MSWEPEVAEIHRRRALASELGGAEAVVKQHARGRLTVRERIDRLVDPQSFREHGRLTGGSDDGKLKPANAVVGSARIDARRCVISGDDFTLHGAYSSVGIRKTEYADRLAVRRRVPIVRLLEAGGASVGGLGGGKGRSGYDFVNGSESNKVLVEARASVPMVAAALGPVAGFPTARLVASHFSLMTRKTAQVMVAGPALVERATGEKLSKEELGSAEVHCKNGMVDNMAEDEDDVFRQIKRFLSYLPSSVWELAPVAPCTDPASRAADALLTLVPREGRVVYKMRKVLDHILDCDSFFELTPLYGRTQITALARLNGHPVGVLANDPYFYGGSMSAESAQKVRRFIELCDTFHLPIVSFMDEPGFMIGSKSEQAGTLRYGMGAMFAVVQSTVPWFTTIVRKSFGVAAGIHFAPHGTVVAWPSAQSGALPLEGGVALAHGREIAEAPAPERRRRELEEHYAKGQSIFPRAEDFGVHDLIDPRETRAMLCEWVEDIRPLCAAQLGPRAYGPRP
jgi:acetyl-CoA carboxylase carboxyltransferase component